MAGSLGIAEEVSSTPSVASTVPSRIVVRKHAQSQCYTMMAVPLLWD